MVLGVAYCGCRNFINAVSNYRNHQLRKTNYPPSFLKNRVRPDETSYLYSLETKSFLE